MVVFGDDRVGFVARWLIAVCVVLGVAGPVRAGPVTVPSNEAALVRRSLSRPQQLSFERDREYCAYLGRTRTGRLKVTAYAEGGRNGCRPMRPAGFRAIASIHTHGSYDRRVPAEFPTTLDMEIDAAEGVNGYVATPGGRFWFLDSRARVAVQLCGPGCLPQDPRFHAGDDGVIAGSYTYQQLKALEMGM